MQTPWRLAAVRCDIGLAGAERADPKLVHGRSACPLNAPRAGLRFERHDIVRPGKSTSLEFPRELSDHVEATSLCSGIESAGEGGLDGIAQR